MGAAQIRCSCLPIQQRNGTIGPTYGPLFTKEEGMSWKLLLSCLRIPLPLLLALFLLLPLILLLPLFRFHYYLMLRLNNSEGSARAINTVV